MPKHDKRGRSKGERFVKLPHYLVGSPAWESLSPPAAKLFIGLLARYNGANNGYLAMSAREAAAHICSSKATAARVFVELQDRGFIELVFKGTFSRQTARASEWRVTLHKCDRSHADASNAFMRYKPDSSPSGGTAKPPAKSKRSPSGETISPSGETATENLPPQEKTVPPTRLRRPF